MESILFITLGTRDIQCTEEIEGITETDKAGRIVIKNPREAGAAFLQKFDDYHKSLSYPIIKPALEYIIRKEGKLDKVWLVCTDQSQDPNIPEQYKKGDTVQFAGIIKRLIQSDFKKNTPLLKQIMITTNVIYYDDMYDFFDKEFQDKFTFKSDDKVFILNQGGIDAINTALLLKCIEYNASTIQLSKPEGIDAALPQNFPAKFVNNTNKQKVLHSIDYFNYQAVIDLDYNEVVNLLAKYAYSRLILDLDSARLQLVRLYETDTSNRSFYTHHLAQIKNDKLDERIKDYWCSIKIAWLQGNFSDFLVRNFTLAEVLLKPLIESELKGKVIFNVQKDHQEWKKLISTDTQLLEFLQQFKINGQALNWSYPNRAAYMAIFDYFAESFPQKTIESIKNLYKILEPLINLRNRVAHSLDSVNNESIVNTLKRTETDIETYFSIADVYFEIQGYGIFDELNHEIKKRL